MKRVMINLVLFPGLLLFLSLSVYASRDKTACLPTGHITTDSREKQTLAATLLEKGVTAQPNDTIYCLFSPRTLSGSWQGGKTGTFAGRGEGKLNLVDTDSNGWETYFNQRSDIKVVVNRDRTVVQHTRTDRSMINTTMYRCAKK